MKRKISPSFEVEAALKAVGEHVRTARLRRAQAAALLAERLGVGRETIARLERGDGGVSAALLFEVLHHYGFTDQLFALGNPDQDGVGKRLEDLQRRKRGSRAQPQAGRRLDPAKL